MEAEAASPAPSALQYLRGVPPQSMENRRDAESVNTLLNIWCEDNKKEPRGYNSRETELRYKNEPFTKSSAFRYVASREPETVTFAYLNLEPALVVTENISLETFLCEHRGCERKMTIGGKERNVWFCQEKEGAVPGFLKWLESVGMTDLRYPAAKLLRTPLERTNWFSPPVAKILYQLILDNYALLWRDPNVKITEPDRIFVRDYDAAKERYPRWIGPRIRELEVIGLEGDRPSYVAIWNGTPVVVGARIGSRIIPPYLRDLIDDALLSKIRGKDPKEIMIHCWREVQRADPSEFFFEQVLKREGREMRAIDRIDNEVKQALDYRYRELVARGVITEDEEETRLLGNFLQGVMTKEKTKEGTKEGIRLLQECSATDLQNVDREWYFTRVMGRPLKRITGIDPESVVGRVVIEKLDGTREFVRQSRKAGKKKEIKLGRNQTFLTPALRP